jgi:uncharacterized integral membrane protein
MEKDDTLKDIIIDQAIIKAPEGFTESIMDRIEIEPAKQIYRPLIRPGILIAIISMILILLIVVGFGNSNSEREILFSIPEIQLNFPDISPILLAGFAGAIISTMLLVISEAELKRKSR